MKTIQPQPGFQQRFTRSTCDVILGGGVLNPQPLTSSILTPSGFVKFSELKAGDIVCGLENETQTVTHCDLEGEKECIRIVLVDGSSAECALDHKWWVRRNGVEDTVISFELLESYQISEEKNTEYDVEIFRYLEGKAVPVKILRIEELGKIEVACIGVSNDDELYITDDYLITKNCGKAQPLDAKVLTPSGWTTMGALKVGDSVCDTNGGRQQVLRVYEKGMRYVYRVTFDGGETECCGEHLWRVYNNETGYTDTLALVDFMHEYWKYSIPCTNSVDFNSRGRLPIDPYTLGRGLSAGSRDRGEISPSMKTRLEMAGCKDFTRVPDDYKYSTVKVRKAFLRGFMDADIVKHETGSLNAFFFYMSKALFNDVREVVQSLGGVMKILDDYDTRVNVSVAMPRQDEYCSRNMKEAKYTERRQLYRKIRDITFVGMKPCRCILVSHPNHLYITDDYIVTHNTFAAILSVAEPSLDPKFRAAFTRRNKGNLKQGGGIIDDFKDAYAGYVHVTESGENPKIVFPSGAFVDCLHIADETPSRLMERAKGWQYDFFYMDELTSYEFSTFRIVRTRCRGKASWSGHVAGTTNPKRSHWTRKILNWYIGADGFIIPERDGVVRYFYVRGDTIDDVVMGGSKEEVYLQCKSNIDQQLKKLAGKAWTYEDLVSSFVFYAGKMSENKASIGNNASYVGSVAGVGGKRAQQLIEGNFNVDEDEEDTILISSSDAQAVFDNDPCRNGDRWITVDLADVGTDNVIALLWDGFHIEDTMILMSSTPKKNADRVKFFATQNSVPFSHIIYDATGGRYMMDYIPEAVGYVSAGSTQGIYALMADRLKDECYLRLADVIKNHRMSISERVGRSRYFHQNIKNEHFFQDEFLEECAVVRMNDMPSGKKKLMSKKEMNARLGKNRSMDLLDPCAMRMLPVLRFPYGEELTQTAIEEGSSVTSNDVFDIFDETSWS